MYGNEKSSKTPSSLFNKEVAMKALNDAKFCLENVANSLNCLKKNKDMKQLLNIDILYPSSFICYLFQSISTIP